MLIFDVKLINIMGRNSTKKHVFLTGYMGSGKSSVGALLAKQLERPFYDLDKEIEREDLLSVSDIFKFRGEEYFRIIESEVLQKLVITSTPAVFALGGGTLTQSENINFVLNHGDLIYLETSVQRLVQRLENESSSRPIIENYKGDELLKFIETHLGSRLNEYQQAHFTVNTDQMPINMIAEKIFEFTKSA